jgi:hypothetical protein
MRYGKRSELQVGSGRVIITRHTVSRVRVVKTKEDNDYHLVIPLTAETDCPVFLCLKGRRAASFLLFGTALILGENETLKSTVFYRIINLLPPKMFNFHFVRKENVKLSLCFN